MKRPQSLVPFERGYVFAALFGAAFTAAVWLVSEIVRGKFGVVDVYLAGGYFVVLVAGLSWAGWHEDNRLERGLRAWRRRSRTIAPPKSRDRV